MPLYYYTINKELYVFSSKVEAEKDYKKAIEYRKKHKIKKWDMSKIHSHRRTKLIFTLK